MRLHGAAEQQLDCECDWPKCKTVLFSGHSHWGISNIITLFSALCQAAENFVLREAHLFPSSSFLMLPTAEAAVNTHKS